MGVSSKPDGSRAWPPIKQALSRGACGQRVDPGKLHQIYGTTAMILRTYNIQHGFGADDRYDNPPQGFG